MDLALRVTKLTAQSLGCAISLKSAISGCVSLTWSRTRYSSWMLPCHRPASLVTLSTAFPSSSRQHIGRLRRSDTSCAGGNLLLPTRLQPLSLLVAMGAPRAAVPATTLLQQPSTRQRHRASHRQDSQPVQAPAKPGSKHRCKRLPSATHSRPPARVEVKATVCGEVKPGAIRGSLKSAGHSAVKPAGSNHRAPGYGTPPEFLVLLLAPERPPEPAPRKCPPEPAPQLIQGCRPQWSQARCRSQLS